MRWLGRLVLGVVVAIVVLLAVEGVLRVTLPVVRTATLPDTMIRAHLENAGFRYDPDLYWYWSMLPSAAMQINEHGFRRLKPMTQAKPAEVTRVVTFGDSQTLGAGVGPEETYSAVAERLLNEAGEGGESWEVLNAGISGFRSLNVYRLLQRRIEAFDPDIVVIDCMPYDSPRDDGALVGRPIGSAATQVRAAMWQSRLYYVMRLGVEKARPDRARWLDRAPLQGDALGHGNHDLIAEWGKERGVTVVFVQYPVSENDWRLGCHTLPAELPGDLPVVPACDALKADGRAARALFQDRNHLTVAGNEVVGKALAEVVGPLRE
ncbi:MAG: SGNH/GDSL hydrolase family protein [Pseudomonadota bacterium]|nr:SGNH/GDSL hydrolase family protein [Pseudomonadota bacterium]